MFTSLMHQSVLMECCLSSRVFFSHEETSYLYDRTGLGPKNGPAILGHGGPPLLFIAHMEESNHVKKKLIRSFTAHRDFHLGRDGVTIPILK